MPDALTKVLEYITVLSYSKELTSAGTHSRLSVVLRLWEQVKLYLPLLVGFHVGHIHSVMSLGQGFGAGLGEHGADAVLGSDLVYGNPSRWDQLTATLRWLLRAPHSVALLTNCFRLECDYSPFYKVGIPSVLEVTVSSESESELCLSR